MVWHSSSILTFRPLAMWPVTNRFSTRISIIFFYTEKAPGPLISFKAIFEPFLRCDQCDNDQACDMWLAGTVFSRSQICKSWVWELYSDNIETTNTATKQYLSYFNMLVLYHFDWFVWGCDTWHGGRILTLRPLAEWPVTNRICNQLKIYLQKR